MFLKNSYSILLYVCVALFSLKAGAQQTNKTVLAAAMEQARTSGVEFKSFTLFSITNGEAHEGLDKETLLLPESDNILRVYETSPAAVSVSIQTADGKTYQLDMQRSYPLAQDANIAFIDGSGRHRFGYDKGVHYQGAVAGSDRSLAAISIFANGEVMGLFANEEGNFVIGKLEDNSGRYILYNDKDFTVTPPTQCAVDDAAAVPAEDGTGGGDKTTAAYECKKVSLYWEADFGVYMHKQSSTTGTQIYMTGLFNQVQTLYRNEKIAVELKTIDIWTVPDNYDSTSSGGGLNTFRSRWNGKGNNFDGDLAMLLARDPGGNGGVAYLDVLCYRPNAYAYGDVNGSYLTVPTYSWDVMMVTHELGHNLGSRHTHWCGWKTGSGGSCGSIDNCTTQESGSGCSTCPSTFSNSQPASAWKGTIMSYCHLVSRGISLANGFGPLPGDAIRDNVGNNSPCLKSIISATLVTTPVCRDTGTIAVLFDTSVVPGNTHFGVDPYNYMWSSSTINAQGINVSTAGNYSVIITDSNGCSVSISATVTQNSDDSCKSLKASVAEVERGYISLYPNPAQSAVAMKFFSNSTESLQIKITDITGKIVINESVTARTGENNITLSLTNIMPGMYFVNISSANTAYKGQKLVIQ